MLALIQNETIKLLRRRRFAIVIGILIAILAMVSYSQYRQLRDQRNRNWRAEIQQRIASYQNTLRRGRVNPSWQRSLRAEINRLQFYLDHDIEPDKPTAPIFVRTFANVAGFLLLPLLIGVLGSDIVSAENAEGTDKLLLTRPVRRWKILTSKHQDRIQSRCDPAASALERHADRVRAGVVRAPRRGIDRVDVVGDLPLQCGVDRNNAGVADRWNDPHAHQPGLDGRKISVRERAASCGLLHRRASPVRRHDDAVLHYPPRRVGDRDDDRRVRVVRQERRFRVASLNEEFRISNNFE